MYKLFFLLALLMTATLFSCIRKKETASVPLNNHALVGSPIIVFNQ